MEKYSQNGSPRRLDRIGKLTAEFLAMEEQSAKEAGTVAYMARSLVLATLPHSSPKDFIFERSNGNITLTMTGNPKFGLPYGSLPRLILAWITREAKIKNSPHINLGKNFSVFLNTLKLTQSGGKRGDATRLRDQMLKLFSTHISCTYLNNNEKVCKSENFLIARSFELWWKPFPTESITKQSTVTLADDFFKEIVEHPVPVDFRMLHALRRSPLQIDIYIWLTYRFSYLKKPSLISWELLSNQFGSNYADTAQGLRDFKREFLKSVRIVTTMYQNANVEILNDGILLKPSKSHVSRKVKQGDN